jgi:hypothetical protein
MGEEKPEMSYTNEVVMTCPHCGHQGAATEIKYQPMGAMFEEGSTFIRATDSKKLEPQARVDCENCGSWFLYRLSVKVVCLVTEEPIYREIVPERGSQEVCGSCRTGVLCTDPACAGGE